MNKLSKENPGLHAICKPLVKKHEGMRAQPYTDTMGFLTIGVGRNLSARGLSESEVDFLYENDLDIAYMTAKNIIGARFEDLTPRRQAVIVDMAFNLGFGKLRQFVKMITAVQEGRYDEAKAEMLNSEWAKQVGSRAKELAQMMLNG